MKTIEKKSKKDAKQLEKQPSEMHIVDDADDNDDNDGHILTYPSTGVGGISIYVPDFKCLAADEFLNDVIINFYLQYIFYEILTPDQRVRTHIFNTFFYEALTSKRVTSDRTNGKKRYDRVEKWTKNMNLFEKDFIIVPINQNLHWFLAIICFPGLDAIATESNTHKSNSKVRKASTANANCDGDESDEEENVKK